MDGTSFVAAVKYFLVLKKVEDSKHQMLCNFCVVDRKMSASLMIVLHYLFTILIIFPALFNMIEAYLLTPSMLAFPRSSIDAYQPLREKESKSLTTCFQPFNVLLSKILSTEIYYC